MNKRGQLTLGIAFFALMFGHLAVTVYASWRGLARLGGSYDGWIAQRQTDEVMKIVGVDGSGPATVLELGDEFVSINGVTMQDDPQSVNYSQRVAPGTRYNMVVRRGGQLREFVLATTRHPLRRWFMPLADVLVPLLFLLTGLLVFLLRPGDQQAWLLALMLGAFTGLFNSTLPPLPLWVLLPTALARIVGILFLPVLCHFFLLFPERSPVLRRFPRLERWLYWPFYLILPWFAVTRLDTVFRGRADWAQILNNLWMFKGQWLARLSLMIAIAYLVGGLVTLLISYRVAGAAARRKLHVIVVGSSAGFLTLLLLVVWETFFQERFPGKKEWIETALKFTLPLIPLSFAYAIIKHRVIPVSLIIRRGVRYVLVARGSILLEIIVVTLGVTAVLTYIFNYIVNPPGVVIGLVSAVAAVVSWLVFSSLHEKYLAPIIDRHFFRQAYDARQIITDLALSLRTTTDLPQLVAQLATKLQAALQTESVTVLLRDDATGDYVSRYACHYSPAANRAIEHPEPSCLPRDAVVVAQLAEARQPLEIDLSVAEPQRSVAEQTALAQMKTALLLPLSGKEGMLGIIALGARLGDLSFSGEDKDLLLSVAGPTALAIENAQLIERLLADARLRQELEAESERRARELEEARQLQLSMLPRTVPQLPHLEIAAYMKTATEVGGDYYDFHQADNGELTIAVGDATGHGLKAGTVVAATKSLFNHLAPQPELPEILRHASRALKRMNLRGLFMALTMAKVDGHKLRLSAAGMPPILLYRAQTQTVEELLLVGVPLGSISSYRYRSHALQLEAGDVVLIMSDGFPERFNAAGEMLGYAPAKEALRRTAAASAQTIIEQLITVGEVWAAGRPQDDDVTFVVLKIKGAEGWLGSQAKQDGILSHEQKPGTSGNLLHAIET